MVMSTLSADPGKPAIHELVAHRVFPIALLTMRWLRANKWTLVFVKIVVAIWKDAIRRTHGFPDITARMTIRTNHPATSTLRLMEIGRLNRQSKIGKPTKIYRLRIVLEIATRRRAGLIGNENQIVKKRWSIVPSMNRVTSANG